MTSQGSNIKRHYLFPSTIHVSDEPCIVDTILGSCISVCLYDTKLKIGGINHFMLPFWNGTGLPSPKYGNIATEKLIEKMQSMGSRKVNMVAKVFGGANQMLSSLSVSERNRLVAQDQLREEGIKIIAESTGGFKGRKIQFNTYTGEVLMKFLIGSNSNKVPVIEDVDSIAKIQNKVG